MLKKIILLALVVMLILCMFPVNAFAGVQWTYIWDVYNSISISGSGYCSMGADMSAEDGVDRCVINSYLQKYVNGAWTNVNNWSKTEYSDYCIWSQGVYVTSGTYRLKSYFYAYDGSNGEGTSLTTGSDSY